ncbi:MAG TPA: cyclodeaminase/cyclohydrolase family protein [Vicinamibacterales bacterium]|jgi:formiminotetrahydrofolate cyclodeaminase
MLVDRSVRDLLAAFSSSDPTPGGGSASALASAIGVSLLTMVAGLPKTRGNSAEDRQALDAAAAALTGLRARLTDAVDADSAAYDRVVAAYRMPKASPDEQTARKAAIQDALRAATDVPLGVVRLSSEGLSQAAVVAAHGHRAAASDVGVALAMLKAGAAGARLNVAINLDGIADASYVDSVRGDVATLSSEIEKTAALAEHALST